MMTECFHISCLKKEFQNALRRNSAYTLSAFARDLGLSRGALSEIFSGKRSISYKTSQKIVSSFDWSFDKKLEFVFHAAKATVESGTRRIHPEYKRILANKDSQLYDAKKIEQEAFVIISEWYHTAILEMTFTDRLAKKDTNKIAERLGISRILVEEALGRLLNLGLLVEEKGVLQKFYKNLALEDPNKTSEGLVKHQEQILQKALEKLNHSPIERRNNTGMAMAIDPRNIPKVKREIRLFMRKICEILESGDQKEVYQLNINLFSLEKQAR